MNLNQLRYALAVAKTGSFTQAAEQCFVTQPTLSNGLAQLEEEFGEKLFVRTTRAVSLTPFGEHVLPYIEKVLLSQTELVDEVRKYGASVPRLIRIGVSPLVHTARFARILEPFRQAHEGIEIIFSEHNMADLSRMLDEGLIDFVAGIASEDSRQSTNRAFLYEEPLFFIPCAGKAAPAGESITVDDIAEETLVMVPDGCGLARATRSLFRSKRKKLKEYAGKALSYQVLEEWSSLGLGAALLPESKLQASKNNSFPLADENGNRVSLIFEALWKDRLDKPHLQEFARYIRSRNGTENTSLPANQS